MRYYTRKGNPYQVYFGMGQYRPISFMTYLKERFIMRSECVRTETQLKAEAFDLMLKVKYGMYSLRDKEDLTNITEIFKAELMKAIEGL